MTALTTIDRGGLPSDVYAERVFLGALLLRPNRVAEFVDEIQPGDFSLAKHGLIWHRMVGLYRDAGSVDRITLAGDLHRRGELESVDGLTYLASLDEGLPEIHHVEAYARLIRDASIRRRLIHAGSKLQAMATDPGDGAETILGRARELIAGIESEASGSGEFRTPFDVIQDAGGIDAYLRHGDASGVPLPWPTAQNMIGGLQPGELAILAGDTGRGKTAAALNMALHAAERQYGVAIFSMEMSRRQVVNRLMALSGRFNSFVFRQRQRSMIVEHDIASAAGLLSEIPLWVRDSTGCTVARMVGGIQRLRAKHDVRLVIVDYLQLMSGDGRSRTEVVGGIARGLKNAAVELGLPIVALSQLSRDHSKAKTVPELHDLRESGDIEQAANLVLFCTARRLTVPSRASPSRLTCTSRNSVTARRGSRCRFCFVLIAGISSRQFHEFTHARLHP